MKYTTANPTTIHPTATKHPATYGELDSSIVCNGKRSPTKRRERSIGRRALAASFVLAGTTLGCGSAGSAEDPSTSGEITSPLYGLVGAPNTYWNGVGPSGAGAPAIGIVNVCWGRNATLDRYGNGLRVVDADPSTSYPGFATISRWWREAVEDTFGRYAWIQFHGWGACDSGGVSDRADVSRPANVGKLMLYYGDRHDDPAQAGSACDILGKSPSQATPCWVSPLGGSNFRQVWQTYGIHEVAHGLGFHHEQVRPDNWSNGTTQECIQTASGENGPFTGGIYWNAIGDTTFVDEESVTCYDQPAGYQLSAGDVIGSQRLYARKPPGAVIGYGGRSVAIAGGVHVNGTPIISWPTSNQWHLTWRAAASNTGLDLFASTDGTTTSYLRVQGGAVSSSSPTPVVTTLSSSLASKFPRTNMQWKAIGDMCVVASSIGAGARLRIQKCGTSGSRERWDYFRPSSRQIRLSGTNLCVQAPNATPVLGDFPVLATCSATGSSRQNFTFTTSNYIRFGSLCMAVFGGLPNASADVGLWNGCDASPQLPHFQFNLTGRLRTLGQCAVWDGNVSDNGRALQMRPCQPAPAPINQLPGGIPMVPKDPQDWDIYW